MSDFHYDNRLGLELADRSGYFDLILDLKSRDFYQSLAGCCLRISAGAGIYIGNCKTPSSPDTVKILLPAEKTVGDLMDALMGRGLAALILCKLAITSDAGERITSHDRKKIRSSTVIFLNALNEAVGDERLRTLLSMKR